MYYGLLLTFPEQKYGVVSFSQYTIGGSKQYLHLVIVFLVQIFEQLVLPNRKCPLIIVLVHIDFIVLNITHKVVSSAFVFCTNLRFAKVLN